MHGHTNQATVTGRRCPSSWGRGCPAGPAWPAR
jgi:hypothetical protein